MEFCETVCLPVVYDTYKQSLSLMPSSGMKDSDINGRENIPLVKQPLINTNLFPGKAALEERSSPPHTCQTAEH